MASYSAPTTQQNEAALDYFIQMPVSREMIQYLAAKASEVIRCEPTALHAGLPTPPASPPTAASDPALPSIETFITSLVERSHVQVPTLMTSLVYLARLKSRLPPMAKGMKCTVHRIFLASLILSAKNLNDSSPKNKHWARYSAVRGYENFGFSITEVNLMEKQLLFLLDWDLNIRSDHLYEHLEPFLAPIRLRIAQKADELARAQQHQQQQQQQQQQQREWQQQQQQQYHQAHFVAQQLNYAHHQHALQQPQQQQYLAAAAAAAAATTASRSSSRTPSLSPPSRSYSSASDHSDLSSVTSMSSPASVSIDAYDAYCPSIVVVDHHQHPQQYVLPDQVQAKDKGVHHLPPHHLSGYGEKSKKARTAGPGFLSRMLGQGGRTQVY